MAHKRDISHCRNFPLYCADIGDTVGTWKCRNIEHGDTVGTGDG